MKRRLAVLVACTGLGLGVTATPMSARAGSPMSVSVTANGAAQSYSGTVAGWPDPNGPPAPGCPPGQCDHETISLSAGSFSTAQYSFAIRLGVAFTQSDPTGTNTNCLDISLLDSTATTVLASQSCVNSGASTLAANLTPGTYIAEVDGNAANGVAFPPQPFTGTVSALAVPQSSGAGGSTNGITFTHEVTVDPNRANGEPDLAINNTGKQMYTSGPWGFTTTVSMAWKTEDAGVQWDLLHGFCATNPLRPFCSRGGGDTELQLGTPNNSGVQPAYFVDLNGLDTLTCALSNDGGSTFNITGGDTTPANPAGPIGNVCNVLPNGSAAAPGSDRQWIAVWPPANNGTANDDYFMIYDTGDTPPSGDDAMMSLDGGQSLTRACQSASVGPPPSTVSCVGGANGYGARPGPLVINPTAINTVTTANGTRWPTLYEFMGTNSTGPEVNISCDGGVSWSHINIAPKMPDDTNTPGGLAITNDFVVGGIDSAGRLYAAWSQQASNSLGQWQTFYTYSTDTAGTSGIGNCSIPVQGATWHTNSSGHPAGIPITGQGSSAPQVNFAVMPWITAGDPGRVDIGYYGDSIDPSSTNPASAGSMTWYLHMAQTLDGASATPTFADVTASETPMHVHSICFSGLACQTQVPPGDRNLADFFELKLDPTGRAVIMYVDDNNTQPGPPASNPGAGIISSVQQATGPSLFGSGQVPALTSGLTQSLDQRNEVTDPSNDALLPAHQPAPGSNVDAGDLTDLKVVPNGSTVKFTFTVKNMGSPQTGKAPPANAIVNNTATAAAHEAHTGAIWLATWHFNNDLWAVWATTDSAGNMTYVAGKPLDVFSSSQPKSLQYVHDPQNNQNHTVPGSVSGNTVEIDAPLNTIGNPNSGSVLYGLTGFTANTSDAVTTAGITGGTAPGSTVPSADGAAGFFDNVDQTPPIDVPLAEASANVPELPSLPLVIALGALAAVGGGVIARRRRARAQAA